LLELQALVTRASFGTPRRTVLGADYNRVCVLLAVLEKRAELPLGNQDVFVSVAGGARALDPAADLALALAIASAHRGRPLEPRTAAFGELGLTGRLRPATQAERRLEECGKLGLVRAVTPKGVKARGKLRLVEAETLREAIRAGLDADGTAGG
jgi:DNA repair protein RadA/Sms